MKKNCLFVLLALSFSSAAQVPYGNNPAAGHYYNVGDTRIYYETYGSGQPLVLLHGGLYGYIDEYARLIPELEKNYRVIAIATRGHGKSGLGSQPFSYRQFAEDTYKTIRHITNDSVILIGFSDGAIQGYYLAAGHPELAKKMVAIGGNFGFDDYDDGVKGFINQLSGTTFEKSDQEFSSGRKKIMPEPDRFPEFIDKIAAVWKEKEYIAKDKIAAIQAPTLIMAGQWDGCPVEQYVALYRLLKNGQVAIVPGSDHIVLFRKPQLSISIIKDYLNSN